MVSVAALRDAGLVMMLAGLAVQPAAAQPAPVQGEVVAFYTPGAGRVCTQLPPRVYCRTGPGFVCRFAAEDAVLTCSPTREVQLSPATGPRCDETGARTGRVFTLQASGRAARGCAEPASSDEPGMALLEEDIPWERAGLRCQNRNDALRCTNRQGHGFHLRFQRQDVF